ncbi:hypothetical protein [Marinicellulosiphila megalodicopiae]|uniref:hypothetical protein n=1 Tax=Marinicellulosiphila megalodicopiae TaxID=2724896 RepID=UPI003BB1DDEF
MVYTNTSDIQWSQEQRTKIGEGIFCCFMGQFTDEILEEEKAKLMVTAQRLLLRI